MPFSFSSFSTLLSEFQAYLKDRIPPAVLYPLATTAVALAIITGYSIGWNSVESTWQQISTTSKAVLTLASALTFFILAFVLNGFQGVVSRWFQGDWPNLLVSWSGQAARHRALWNRRRSASLHIHALHNRIDEVHRLLTTWGERPEDIPQVVVTKRQLARYAYITKHDLELQPVEKPPADALVSLDDAVNCLMLRPLPPGTPVVQNDLLRLSSGSTTQSLALVPLTVALERIPGQLAPGDSVSIYACNTDKAELINSNGWTIVDISNISRPLSTAGIKLVVVTLAVPRENVSQLLSISPQNISLVVQPSLTFVAPTEPPSEQHNARLVSSAQNTPSLSQPTVHASAPTLTDISTEILRVEQHILQGKQWLEDLRVKEIIQLDDGGYPDIAHKVVEVLDVSLPLAAGEAEQLEILSERAIQCRKGLLDQLEQARREIEYRLDQSRKQFRLYYPSRVSAIAPTAIGNVFRAVDSYAADVYGLDAALVLPRLQMVMDKAILSQLRAAEERLFLLEWTCIGTVVASSLGALIAYRQGAVFMAMMLWLIGFPCALLIYHAALSAALGYAELLRLVFDRERGKVLGLLGLALPKPTDQKQERELWKSVGQWWEYGELNIPYIVNSSAGDGTTSGDQLARSRR